MKAIWGAFGITLGLLLGGCSVLPQFSVQRPIYPGRVDWTKDGVSPHDTAMALADCLSEARAATLRDTSISTDIRAARPNSWSHIGLQPVGAGSPYVLTASQGQLSDAEEQRRANSIVKNCMIDKGFVPADVEAAAP